MRAVRSGRRRFAVHEGRHSHEPLPPDRARRRFARYDYFRDRQSY